MFHEVSEDTHWSPFLKTSIEYIRRNYPQPWNEVRLINFCVIYFVFQLFSSPSLVLISSFVRCRKNPTFLYQSLCLYRNTWNSVLIFTIQKIYSFHIKSFSYLYCGLVLMIYFIGPNFQIWLVVLHSCEIWLRVCYLKTRYLLYFSLVKSWT